MSGREVVCRACGTQRAALTEAMAEAWDEGWDAAWSPMSMHNRADGPNPYRADAIAQTAPEDAQEGAGGSGGGETGGEATDEIRGPQIGADG